MKSDFKHLHFPSLHTQQQFILIVSGPQLLYTLQGIYSTVPEKTPEFLSEYLRGKNLSLASEPHVRILSKIIWISAIETEPVSAGVDATVCVYWNTKDSFCKL